MTPRRGLGRGLDALLAGTVAAEESSDGVLIEVDPHAVEANPEQPRLHFHEGDLSALAESIRLHGLLQPIIVERTANGHRLVAGERRLRAARLGEVRSIPAIVRPAAESARHALELALTENLLRTDLSPMEEAAAYSRLADTFGLAHEAIALRVGRSRPVISNSIRLLALPADVQAAVGDGRITAGHARALLGLESSTDQAALAKRIVAQGLSVRDTERAVRTHLAAAGAEAPRRTQIPNDDEEALRRGLEAVLGTPVRLDRGPRGGRVVIPFATNEDLHALYARIGGPQL